MRGKYAIADKTIEICTLGPETHVLCAAYRAEGAADFSVQTDASDIEFERARSAREDAREGRDVRPFSDGYLETLAVYRKIAEKMPEYDTMLMHGSCVAVDGVGYLFTAKSGTGKSTHTRLWREAFGARAVMINDDKPLLRVCASVAVVYGTPWDGKHRLSTNASAKLRAICILERAQQNAISPISAMDAYPMLLQQIYRPASAAAMEKTLALLDMLTLRVDFWRLGCNMEIEAAQIAYNAMHGKEEKR